MKKACGKYLFSLLLFGSNGIVSSHISLPSSEIVLMRTLVGSLTLIAVLAAAKKEWSFLRFKRQLAFIALSGMAMGASWIFLYEAYREIGVGVASLAYYCGPVIVMALAPLLFHERLTWTRAVGFLSVLAGIFLINGQAALAGKPGWGIFCGAMSAVAYAVMLIFNKKAAPVTGLENAALQLLFSFLTVAAVVGFRQGFTVPEAADWPPILCLGLVNTGIGCYLYFSAVGRLPVQTLAVCGYLEPLSAVAFSALFLGEALRPLQIAGAALVLGGALFGETAGTFFSRFQRKKHGLTEIGTPKEAWAGMEMKRLS